MSDYFDLVKSIIASNVAVTEAHSDAFRMARLEIARLTETTLSQERELRELRDENASLRERLEQLENARDRRLGYNPESQSYVSLLKPQAG